MTEKEPKDLGVKIGNEEEAFWYGANKKLKTEEVAAMHELEINRVVQKYCQIRIEQEKEKFK